MDSQGAMTDSRASAIVESTVGWSFAQATNSDANSGVAVQNVASRAGSAAMSSISPNCLRAVACTEEFELESRCLSDSARGSQTRKFCSISWMRFCIRDSSLAESHCPLTLMYPNRFQMVGWALSLAICAHRCARSCSCSFCSRHQLASARCCSGVSGSVPRRCSYSRVWSSMVAGASNICQPSAVRTYPAAHRARSDSARAPARSSARCGTAVWTSRSRTTSTTRSIFSALLAALARDPEQQIAAIVNKRKKRDMV